MKNDAKVRVNPEVKTADITPVEKSETVIYMGESLPSGVLEQFTVFKNGFPPFIEEEIKKCPAIKSLMVPIEDLSASRQRLLVQGTLEHTLNQKIQHYTRSGK